LLRRTFARLVAAALLAGVCFAQELKVGLVAEHLIESRLESGLVKERGRQAAIQSLFSDVGCATVEQKVTRSAANVICTLTGETDSVIVVGGHFDFVDLGQGIVDDWSGASLLPSLYQSLKDRPRRHTYIFVAFAAEENGLVGSARYVYGMTRERKAAVRAFVNLECLGLDPLVVWQSRANPALLRGLYEVAQALGARIDGVNVERVGDDDSRSFLSAHIPVITLHSLTPETWSVIHSPRDNLKAIKLGEYYASYRLIAFYLAYLDQKTE